MTTSQQLEITFSSGRSGTGPATWGQRAIWTAVSRLAPADAPRYNITVATPLEQGVPLPAVLDALGHLLHLHDSLHTRLHLDEDGVLRQTVDPAGRLPVHSRPCDGSPQEADETGRALHDELAALPFDCAEEWPIRIGLVESAGLVRHMTLVLSHTAVDGTGMSRLVMDLTELVLGTSPERIRELRPSQQPLEEADFQTSERGRRRDSNARQHALRKLRLGPPRLFPLPAGADPERRFPNAELTSPALLRAVDLVAAGHRASSASVLLAAIGAMTSRLSGHPDAVLQVIVNNRFLPGLTHAVNVVAGDAVLHLPDAGEDFAALVRRTHASTIAAYRHAYFDKQLLDEDIEKLTTEQVPLADRSCIVNDTRELAPPPRPEDAEAELPPAGEPLTRTRARTTLTWPVDFEPRPGLSYALDALQTPVALRLSMTADPAVLPRPDIERFLYGVEELVLTEAHALGHA
ncbi:condensation domain-containing protein [Kitasatospora sp. NPDC052868]|uniref:condensation domain-containing protein n=1 Tax=Kitasatospora sp. NPDC052868 TaxID=3364060 RepID=UPI0037CA7C38